MFMKVDVEKKKLRERGICDKVWEDKNERGV